MKKKILQNLITMIIVCLVSLPSFTNNLLAKDGDTLKVRAIEFTNPRAGWVDFPASDKKFAKIYANYKLKCPPGKACGEWDYLAYVFVQKWFAPNYRAKNTSPATYKFMKDTSWTYTTQQINGKWELVKTAKPSFYIYFYNDPVNLTKKTDSILAWPTYYGNFKIDANGKKTDSTLIKEDSLIKLVKKPVDYKDSVTVSEDYEIMRYITPYGNGLNLGDGFNWIYDVSDFRTMLNGRVYIYAPCGGWGDQSLQTSMESLELTFDFIEGEPERDIINIRKMWDLNSVTYDANLESVLSPIKLKFNTNEKNVSLKMINTGHGFGGNNDNCSEFCKKESYVKVNGSQKYSRFIWKECGDNPVFPQGGTWLTDRTNWCPGAEVPYHDFELTKYINFNDSNAIDYDMEYYNNSWDPKAGSSARPNWRIYGWLVTYSDLKRNIDISITDIIKPTNKDYYRRLNPICNEATIVVKNTGKDKITKIKFQFTVSNLPPQTYTWTGDLASLESREISFPLMDLSSLSNTQQFHVEAIEVNDKTGDEYAANNHGYSTFEMPHVYGNNFVIELTTPDYSILNAQSPFRYYLRNSNGDVIKQYEITENKKSYKDTLNLPVGCYEFELINIYGYGLYYWVLDQQYGLKSGNLKLSSNGISQVNFNKDFGNRILYQFIVGEKPVIKTSIVEDQIDFGTVNINNKSTMKFDIYGGNSKGLVVSDIKLNLAQTKKFSIKSVSKEKVNGVYTLAKDEKLQVEIEFEPMKAGLITTQMIITSNDELNVSKSFTLKGIGRDTTSAVETNDILDLNMISNISNNELNLEFNTSSDKDELTSIELYNSLGVKIAELFNDYAKPFSNRISYNIKQLPSASYYLIMKVKGNSKTLPLVIVE